MQNLYDSNMTLSTIEKHNRKNTARSEKSDTDVMMTF